jgi:hypothetical protein
MTIAAAISADGDVEASLSRAFSMRCPATATPPSSLGAARDAAPDGLRSVLAARLLQIVLVSAWTSAAMIAMYMETGLRATTPRSSSPSMRYRKAASLRNLAVGERMSFPSLCSRDLAGVAEDFRAVAEHGRGRPPAFGETRLQKLVGGWSVIPDGDRRQPAQSGRVEDQRAAIRERGDDVVGELVLDDDVDDGPALCDLPQGLQRGELGR